MPEKEFSDDFILQRLYVRYCCLENYESDPALALASNSHVKRPLLKSLVTLFCVLYFILDVSFFRCPCLSLVSIVANNRIS